MVWDKMFDDMSATSGAPAGLRHIPEFHPADGFIGRVVHVDAGSRLKLQGLLGGTWVYAAAGIRRNMHLAITSGLARSPCATNVRY